MSALPRAEYKVKTGEFIRDYRSAQIWRMTDWFDVTLYAVVVNGEVIHECDDEWAARLWITRNI